jgi:hypothetical protein
MESNLKLDKNQRFMTDALTTRKTLVEKGFTREQAEALATLIGREADPVTRDYLDIKFESLAVRWLLIGVGFIVVLASQVVLLGVMLYMITRLQVLLE